MRSRLIIALMIMMPFFLGSCASQNPYNQPWVKSNNRSVQDEARLFVVFDKPWWTPWDYYDWGKLMKTPKRSKKAPDGYHDHARVMQTKVRKVW